MPCYQLQTVSVEFKAANYPVLDKAIKALGWTVEQRPGRVVYVHPSPDRTIAIDLDAGTAQIQTTDQQLLNRLKQAYSGQALALAARLNGWQLRPAGTNKGQLVKGFF